MPLTNKVSSSSSSSSSFFFSLSVLMLCISQCHCYVGYMMLTMNIDNAEMSII